MKRNMYQWVEDLKAAPVKKAMPGLSFPSIQLLGITVQELINDSDIQAKGMKAVADRAPKAGGSVSLAVGANGVVIAEPLAGLLSPALAQEFPGDYCKRIVDTVQDENFIVVYHNCGNTTILTLDSILSCGAKVYHHGMRSIWLR